jgi:hypothetical protein
MEENKTISRKSEALGAIVSTSHYLWPQDTHYCSMLMKQAEMVLRKTAHTFMIGNTKNSQAEKLK